MAWEEFPHSLDPLRTLSAVVDEAGEMRLAA
jgi:hypothetical protein